MKKIKLIKKKWYKQYWLVLIFGFISSLIVLTTLITVIYLSKAQKQQIKQFKQTNYLITNDDPSIGPDDAPIHIVEFSDLQCPFCQKMHPILKEVVAEYGDKVHYVYRDFPVKSHRYAQKSAEAVECAQNQNKAWELIDEIFADQKNIKIEDLKRKALQIEMPDMIKFNQCLDSGQYEQEVKDDYNTGEKSGVRGTPTFYINGKIIPGAVPKETIIEIIESILMR